MFAALLGPMLGSALGTGMAGTMASSMIMGGLNSLMGGGGGGGGGGGAMPSTPNGMAQGVAPKLRDPMDLTQGTAAMAGGGIASIYPSGMDEGGMIRGPGSGVDDEIGGTIDNRQEVLLSDGEFVVPARVVSALGDGSSEYGAKVLHEMIKRVKAEADDRLKDNDKISLNKVLPA